MKKATKGTLFGIAILFAGLQFSKGTSDFIELILVALLTTFLFIKVIKTFVAKRSEKFLIAALIGLIETYELLIVPNTQVLPGIGGEAALFFGLVGFIRLAFLVLEETGNAPASIERLIS